MSHSSPSHKLLNFIISLITTIILNAFHIPTTFSPRESTKQTGHCDRNELLSRIEDANIQIDQIQSESDTQITVLQEQLADSKIELEKAENAIKSAVQERDTNTDLTEAVTRRYETVIEENRVKIEELKATLVKNTESFEKLINSHSELETDNEQVNSVLQNYIRQFDEQKLVLNELSSKYDQLETETGEKSVVISDLEVQFEKLDSLKISLETMLEEAKIENQSLVDQLVVLPGLTNEVDELKQRNVLLEEKSEKERNLLEHAEKELEGLKNEGSDQNEYSALNAAVFPFIMCAILWIIWVVVVVFLG